MLERLGRFQRGPALLMWSDTQPLEFASGSWEPAASVTTHAGESLDPSMDFFSFPPAEIGEVATASSTLRRNKGPLPLLLRLVLVLSPGLLALVVGERLIESLKMERGDSDGVRIVVLLVGLASAGSLWRVTRFAHTCSFVGANGVARFRMTRSRLRSCKAEVFQFADASELRTSQTRHYHAFLYLGTEYNFTWTNSVGERRYRLKGSYYSSAGKPNAKCGFYFALSAERAWSAVLAGQSGAPVEQDGSVQFRLKGLDWVRVGPGFVEFSTKWTAGKFETEQIEGATMSGGSFCLWCTDFKWASGKGTLRFDYGHMANARVFLLALEQLVGIRI